MLDKIKKLFGLASSQPSDVAEGEDLVKSYKENQVLLEGMTSLAKSLQLANQTQDDFNAKNEEFLKNLRTEGRGF